MNSEEITFTKEEIIQLSKEVANNPLLRGDKILWKKAFDYYNLKHNLPRPLNMTCRPCYIKVVIYIASHFKEASGG